MSERFVEEGVESVFIGKFPQGPNGEVEPIEWYAKKNEDGTTTLISRYLLARKCYDKNVITKWLKNELATYLPAGLIIEEMRCPKRKEVYEFFPLDGRFPKYEGDDWPCHNRQAAWTEYALRQKAGWQHKVYDLCRDGNAGWWLLEDFGKCGRIAVSTIGTIDDGVHPMDQIGIRPCMVIRM